MLDDSTRDGRMRQVRGHPHDLTGLDVQADADDELGIAVKAVRDMS